MNKIYTRTIFVDFDGNYNVEIPYEVCEHLNLKPDDIVVWEVIDGSIMLKKRQE